MIRISLVSYNAGACQRANAQLKEELRQRDAIKKPSVVKNLNEQLERRDVRLNKVKESNS